EAILRDAKRRTASGDYAGAWTTLDGARAGASPARRSEATSAIASLGAAIELAAGRSCGERAAGDARGGARARPCPLAREGLAAAADVAGEARAKACRKALPAARQLLAGLRGAVETAATMDAACRAHVAAHEWQAAVERCKEASEAQARAAAAARALAG